MTKRVFECKLSQIAIASCSKRGPWFGIAELALTDEPMNKEYACRSNSNKRGYQIFKDSNGNNKLTGKAQKDFTIVEMEVWRLSYLPKE